MPVTTLWKRIRPDIEEDFNARKLEPFLTPRLPHSNTWCHLQVVCRASSAATEAKRFHQWSAYFDDVLLDIIITGDLNVRLDNPTEPDIRRFSETVVDRGMAQLVRDATHRMGHTLDIVVVRDNTSIIPTRPSVNDPCL